MRTVIRRLFWCAALALAPGCILDRFDATRVRDATGGQAGNLGAASTLSGAGNSAAVVTGGGVGAATAAAVSSGGAATTGGVANTRTANQGGVAGVAATAQAGSTASTTNVGGRATGGATSTGGTSSSSAAMGGSANSSVAPVNGGSGGGASGGANPGGTSSGGATLGGSSATGGAGVAGGTFGASILHAPTYALGGHRYRVTYDFSSVDQLLDWVVPDASCTEALSVDQGELAVDYCDFSRQGGLALAQFKYPLQVTSLTLDARNITSVTPGFEHTNIYLATLFQGSWSPSTGYGCIFTGHRFFTMSEDESAENTDGTFGNARDQPYLHSITMSPTQLSWTSRCSDPGDPRPAKTLTSLVTAFYSGTSRFLLIGGYESSNRFDNIVIEGVFKDM